MIRGPYHLFSIAVLIIITYLFSLLLVRMLLVSSRNHRKFWNTLLLLFFLFTALPGLLLVVKVNYKLEFSWFDEVMQWHVDMGIGLALVSFFHLSWHLGYFKRILIREGKSSLIETQTHLGFSHRQTTLLFLLLGMISIIAQLVLLREFTKTFHGNELTIGIFLAIWMMLTSAGAWAGSGYRAKISGPTLFKLFIFLGIFPLFLNILLILTTRIILLPGYDPGMLVSISYIIILITPFTLVSGFLFSYISKSLVKRDGNSTFYMLDSMGSLIGGILFGLILVFFLDNIQVLSLLFLLSSLSVILICKFPSRIYQKLFLLATGLIVCSLLMIPGYKNRLEGVRFRGESILETKDTPFGNLTFSVRNGQVTGYMDRNPVFTSMDLASAEETVHFPSLQHPDPASFLLIGGGLSGKASEISKYNPQVFDYCEADPRIYLLGRKHIPGAGQNDLNFINRDGRNWLQGADSSLYDLIISAVGDPYTIGWNRYYTEEFYRLVHSHLLPGGFFGMQLSTGGNYINDEGSEMLNINFQTLKKVFKNVVVIPGTATHFLASDCAISLDLPQLLKKHELIKTTYVHPDYLELTHLQFDSDQLTDRISGEQSGINNDFRPLLFFKSISSWNSRFGENSMDYTVILGVIIFLVLYFSFSPLKTGMFVAGFSGAGIQVMLIIVIQSLYGFAYMVTPVMITIFMAGIVTGTRIWRIVWGEPSVKKYSELIWIMALSAAAAIVFLKTELPLEKRVFGQVILGLLNLIPGIITGSVYGMSLSLHKAGNYSGIGRIFSADLAGAALGSFIPAVFILPLIGVINTFILFCGINLATGLYLMARQGQS